MNPLTVEEAQANLPDLINQMTPGDEVVITRDERPIARLIAVRPSRKRREPGNCEGLITVVCDDDE